MSNGQLQCCGSPLFLKKKYGVGYNMTIVKTSDSTDVKPITNLIQFHVNDAKLQTSAGTEVSYSLPHENSHKFEVLFTEIENRRQKLGIDSYGVSITTMEEVFLKYLITNFGSSFFNELLSTELANMQRKASKP